VSPIVFIINQFASILDALWTQAAWSLNFRLQSSIDSASGSRILSAPSVSGA
jgi:hypothetical protein